MIPRVFRRLGEICRAPDSALPWAGVVSLLLLFVGGQAITRCVLRIIRLPEDSYTQGWLLPELIIRFPWRSPAALLVIPILAALIWHRTRLRLHWGELEHGRPARWLIGSAAFMLTWQGALYPYNYYLDHWHGADRLLLLVLCGLVCWRPFFVFPFLLVGLSPIFQLQYPLLGFSWSPVALPLQVLALFGAFLLLGRLAGSQPGSRFLLGVVCLIAAHYWASGYLKLRMGWLFYDQVHFLLPNTYASGWLGFLEADTISRLARGAAYLNPLIKVFTLTVECLCLFVLVRGRRSIGAFLLAWIVFHLGIYAFTGICLWQWVVIEAVLFFWLRREPTLWEGPTPRSVAIAAALMIGGAPFWMNLPTLTWSDARATYTYDFIAVGEDGQAKRLTPHFFAPNYYEFSLGRFSRLVRERPLLPIVWGATDKPTALALNDTPAPDAILDLEQEEGREWFNVRYEERFIRFIRQFVGHYNQRQGNRDWLRWLSYPPVTQHWPRDDRRLSLPIRTVRIRQRLTFFDGREYRTLRDLPVLDLEIPSPRPESGSGRTPVR